MVFPNPAIFTRRNSRPAHAGRLPGGILALTTGTRTFAFALCHQFPEDGAQSAFFPYTQSMAMAQAWAGTHD